MKVTFFTQADRQKGGASFDRLIAAHAGETRPLCPKGATMHVGDGDFPVVDGHVVLGAVVAPVAGAKLSVERDGKVVRCADIAEFVRLIAEQDTADAAQVERLRIEAEAFAIAEAERLAAEIADLASIGDATPDTSSPPVLAETVPPTE